MARFQITCQSLIAVLLADLFHLRLQYGGRNEPIGEAALFQLAERHQVSQLVRFGHIFILQGIHPSVQDAVAHSLGRICEDLLHLLAYAGLQQILLAGVVQLVIGDECLRLVGQSDIFPVCLVHAGILLNQAVLFDSGPLLVRIRRKLGQAVSFEFGPFRGRHPGKASCDRIDKVAGEIAVLTGL